MRIVFMGTPESAVTSLQRCIADGHEVVAVWTQPDKSSGRGNKVTPSAVKALALAHGLPVYQPAQIKTDEAKALFASHGADAAIVVAYGRILPPEFLHAPRLGCINVHFSFLPKYRGAAPVNWAIINGEEKTGVSTMFIEPELDSGPILLQREISIGETETAAELMGRLATLGADLLSTTLAQLSDITPRPQNHEEATFAPLLAKEHGLIDWSAEAFALERRVRGLQPWPNAYSFYKGRRLTIWQASAEKTETDANTPGTITQADKNGLVVACGGGSSLRLLNVQPEGSRRMTATEFTNGAHLQTGERLG
ncbi:MAG: methionyl-tRNA formyltransferase [Pyrinomonadaceae bacterium]